MDVLDLFPTPLGLRHLGRELTEEEIAIFKNLQKHTYVNGGGNLTTDNTFILEIDSLSNLKSLLTKYVNEYFKQVFNPKTEIELYITQSWLNINDEGTWHHPHSHQNSLVSCVYYVNTGQGDEISFKNPNDFLGTLHIESDNPSRWCVNDLKIPAIKNHALIFPSNFYHMVPKRPSTLGGTRISLSFNTWFKGEIGDTRKLSSLKCI